MKKKFSLFSRTHPLDGYFPSWMENIYLKREDELFFHSFGSKARKIWQLKKLIENHEFECVYVVGSRRSYNLNGIVALLHSEKIFFKVITNEVRDTSKSTFSQKIIDSLPSELILITPSLDSDSTQILANQDALENGIENFLFIPEGGSIKELLNGPEKIGKEISLFEKKEDVFFSKICISSGSGHTAIGIINHFIQTNNFKDREFILTLVAGNMEQFQHSFKKLTNYDLPLIEELKILYLIPTMAPKFGKLTEEVIDEMKLIFRETGILADPFYETKHWNSLKNHFDTYLDDPNVLIVHNSNIISVSENWN